jgi:hypothetical protein
MVADYRLHVLDPMWMRGVLDNQIASTLDCDGLGLCLRHLGESTDRWLDYSIRVLEIAEASGWYCIDLSSYQSLSMWWYQ